MAARKTPDGDRAMSELLSTSRSSTGKLLLDGCVLDPSRVIEVLGPLLSEERRVRIGEVVAGRTYNVATVVEGVINTGNVSAVMRSAEALGFQSFHVISGDLPYKHSARTTQGAQKWLDVTVWDSADACINSLKESGFRIVVTHVDEAARPLHELDCTRKTVLVFGNELNGVSDRMLEMADETCVIPTIGFVQSFNVSVAAALTLHQAYRFRVRTFGRNGDLTEPQFDELRADFYIRALEHANRILRLALESDEPRLPGHS